MLETDQSLNAAAFSGLADETELALYKKQRARELLQLQADAFFKEQKRWT